MKRKITVGFVIQDFDDTGKLLSQEFVAGDQEDYEDEKGNTIESEGFYAPYDMVQPH